MEILNDKQSKQNRTLKGRGCGRLNGKKIRLPKNTIDNLTGKTEGMVVFDGENNRLKYYPEEVFGALALAASEDDNISDEYLAMYGTATRTEIDEKGKLAIPKELLDLAQLEPGELVVTGTRDHINIFGPESFEDFQSKIKELPSVYDR